MTIRAGHRGTDPARRRRGRVLVVGAEEAVAPHLVLPPTVAGTLFDAIGEVARASSGHPIAVAIVDDALLPDPKERAAEALRRLDPGIEILRLLPAGASIPTPGADGFDGAIQRPVEPDQLAALIGADLIRTTTNGHPPTAPLDDPAGMSIETIATTPEAAPVGHDLGDIDLIDAIMTNPEGVRDTAVAVIATHTHWRDVGFQTAAPDGVPHVPVLLDGREAGFLCATDAHEAELRGWAQWLGQWLLLDDAYRGYRRLAFRDDLTGAWNRRYFHRFLDEIIREAGDREPPVTVTVMVFDIDDFKRYNDAYGHEAGDVILCETVALLHSVIRNCDRVCRIGGDEFAVIFADLESPREAGSSHPTSVETIACRFQEQVCQMRFPKLGLEAPGTLSISAGLATFPRDGDGAASLLRLADQRALASKQMGKNTITFGPGAAAQSKPQP